MSFNDIALSSIGSLFVILFGLFIALLWSFYCMEVFLRNPLRFSNLIFFLFLFGFFCSFFLSYFDLLSFSKSDDMLSFFLFLFGVMLPTFFGFSSFGMKVFSSPRESVWYATTVVIGIYLLSFYPDVSARYNYERIQKNSFDVPVVEVKSCDECEYKMIGKLGDYVIAYDSRNSSVVSVNDKNVEVIRHKPYFFINDHILN
ncbi:hypothetical protein LG301_04180 [Vreelandella venusta]|uniref:hypothetical protein n=1 Tax=Vreelandella venusta TaxID=44935 RepID=UPI00384D7A58